MEMGIVVVEVWMAGEREMGWVMMVVMVMERITWCSVNLAEGMMVRLFVSRDRGLGTDADDGR